MQPPNEPSVQSAETAESVNISFQCHYEPGLGTEGKFEEIRGLELADYGFVTECFDSFYLSSVSQLVGG